MTAAELERGREERVRAAGRFWQGVIVGVFGVVLMVTAIGGHLLSGRGVSIFIDQEMLADAVRAKVRARAAQELPVMLARVADDAAGRLLPAEGDAPVLTLQFGERRLVLPVETTNLLWNEFRGVAKESVHEALADFDLSPYASELAEEAYLMVQKTLSEEVYGKTFRFQANRWLSLPVTVQGKPQ